MPRTLDNSSTYEKLDINIHSLRGLASILIEKFRTNHKPVPVSTNYVTEQVVGGNVFFLKSIGFVEKEFRKGLAELQPPLSDDEIDQTAIAFIGDKKSTSIALMSGLSEIGFYNRKTEVIPEGWMTLTQLKTKFRQADGSEPSFDSVYKIVEQKKAELASQGKKSTEIFKELKQDHCGWFANTDGQDRLTLFINPDKAEEFGLITREMASQKRTEAKESLRTKLSQEEITLLDSAFTKIVNNHLKRIDEYRSRKDKLFKEGRILEAQMHEEKAPEKVLELYEQSSKKFAEGSIIHARITNHASFSGNTLSESREIGAIRDAFINAGIRHKEDRPIGFSVSKMDARTALIMNKFIPELEKVLKAKDQGMGGSLVDENRDYKSLIADKLKEYGARLDKNKGAYIDAVVARKAEGGELDARDMSAVNKSISSIQRE